jgi:hypothetical protein
MNGRFQMQGGKSWILPKEVNANRFFWASHCLENWSNHFFPSIGLNGGSVAMDSVCVSLSTANRMDVQGVTISTARNMDMQCAGCMSFLSQ